jgi:hypothetical protein
MQTFPTMYIKAQERSSAHSKITEKSTMDFRTLVSNNDNMKRHPIWLCLHAIFVCIYLK